MYDVYALFIYVPFIDGQTYFHEKVAGLQMEEAKKRFLQLFISFPSIIINYFSVKKVKVLFLLLYYFIIIVIFILLISLIMFCILKNSS